MPPSAMTGMPCLAADLGTVHDGGDLGHAHAGDDAGGADGAGPDADLDRVGAGVDQVPGGVGRGDVAGDDVDLEALLDLLDRVDDVLRVAVGGIDADDIDIRCDQGFDPLVLVHADGGSDPQPAAAVPGGLRVLLDAVDIPHRDQAGQFALAVDQQQLLDLVVPEDALGLFETGAGRAGDQVGLGHDGADLDIEILEELQIAPGEDADELLALDDRDARDVLLAHQFLGPADGLLGREGDRVEDDAVLGPLDLGDLPPLGLDGEVLVDDADAAFLGQGDGQGGLGDRIHGRRDDRDVDRDVFREPGAGVRLVGHEIALARDQEDIIECNAFGDNLAAVHWRLQQRFRFNFLKPATIRTGGTDVKRFRRRFGPVSEGRLTTWSCMWTPWTTR